MTIAVCIAELASAAPTSGGLYYWTYQLSSERYRCYLCWLVGCEQFSFLRQDRTFHTALDSNTVGYVSAFASADYATALQIFAAITIGSGGTFEPTTGQT